SIEGRQRSASYSWRSSNCGREICSSQTQALEAPSQPDVCILPYSQPIRRTISAPWQGTSPTPIGKPPGNCAFPLHRKRSGHLCGPSLGPCRCTSPTRSSLPELPSCLRRQAKSSWSSPCPERAFCSRDKNVALCGHWATLQMEDDRPQDQ